MITLYPLTTTLYSLKRVLLKFMLTDSSGIMKPRPYIRNYGAVEYYTKRTGLYYLIMEIKQEIE